VIPFNRAQQLKHLLNFETLSILGSPTLKADHLFGMQVKAFDPVQHLSRIAVQFMKLKPDQLEVGKGACPRFRSQSLLRFRQRSARLSSSRLENTAGN
jgi:hypothetical protein